MGWGLNHKAAGDATSRWMVSCYDCDNCLPVAGVKPNKNRCKVVSGEFYSVVQRYCDHHPRTIWRKKFIEELNRKKRSGYTPEGR